MVIDEATTSGADAVANGPPDAAERSDRPELMSKLTNDGSSSSVDSETPSIVSELANLKDFEDSVYMEMERAEEDFGASAAEQSDRATQRDFLIRSSLSATSSVFTHFQRENAVVEAFDAIDIDNSGNLDQEELFIFLRGAAVHAKLEVEDDVIHAAVRHLIEQQQHEEGREESLKKSISDKFITIEIFFGMFERNPELYRVFDTVEEQIRRSNQCNSLLQEDEEGVEFEKKSYLKSSNQIWKVAKLGWKRQSLVVFWLLLFVAATITVFTKITMDSARKEELSAMFGNWIAVARASARTLNLNAALILLPISRHLITSLRHAKLPLPFDISLGIHVLIGTSFAILAITHVMAHVFVYERLVSADQEDLEALFGDKLGGPIPTSKIGRLGLMMKQRATITGIIMVICLVLAYSSIRSRRQNFNRFWYLHHLLLIMLIMMCVHGTGNLIADHQSIYWICGPLALYIFPRLYRELSRRKVMLLSARAVGDILDIRLEKPGAWERTQRAGMYALINIPEISKAEWHPFTLCSSPADDHLRFSIRNAGDWTNKLHKMVLTDEADVSITSKDNGSLAGMEEAAKTTALGRLLSKRVELRPSLANQTIRVEGPFGASSQGFSEYPIVVLVGAGIGVTPMISVLNMLSKRPGKMVRVFFYWTVRDRSSLALYSRLMEEIYEKDDKNKISIRYFLTSAKRDGRHLGCVLLSHAARCIHADTNEDIISGHKSRQPVEIGRPDWDMELQGIIGVAKELGQKQVGIFLCGPDGLADDVKSNSRRLNEKEKDMYVHFTKETF